MGLGPTGWERHRIAGWGHLLLVCVQFYGRAAKWQEGPLWLADTCQALVVGDDPRAIAHSPLQMLGQSKTFTLHCGLWLPAAGHDAVVDHLAKTAYDPAYGARHLHRNIERLLLQPLAEASDRTATARMKRDEIVWSVA